MLKSPSAIGALSTLVPGLGHVVAGRRERGAAILGAAACAVGVALWLGQAAVWLLLIPFWLASGYDALCVSGGRRAPTAWLVLLGALPFYVAGWQATAFSPETLVTGFRQVRPLLGALLRPDLITTEHVLHTDSVTIYTPCRDSAATPATISSDSPSVSVTPACADFGEEITVSGAGYPPDSTVALTWTNPGGERSALGSAHTDSEGRFAAVVVVPRESVPELYRREPQRQELTGTVTGEKLGYRPSETLRRVVAAMGVTIAAGLVATLLGAVLAVPFSVLGARNLLPRSPPGNAVYFGARFVMNVLRAIEPIILAIVFVVWVGMGPFAGVLALTLHSVAALGKLYSEQIEAIDPGPVEAVRATGANWLQTVSYAVIPQVVPQFTAFTVYRWDINVRMSTVLGFVGGGGIGYLLIQWIKLRRWSEVSTSVLVIALVVMALDVLSARVRRRIAHGRPLVRRRLRPLALAAMVLLAVWAWRTTRIDVGRLVGGAADARPIISDLLHPALVQRDFFTETARTSLVVPCGFVDPPLESDVAPAPDAPGPHITIDAYCASPWQKVTVTGHGFTPSQLVNLRWILPGGGRLRAVARGVETDDDGEFETAVEVRPLLAESGPHGPQSIGMVAEAEIEIGAPHPSDQLKKTIDELVGTVLMALWATTLGAALALPLALAGARNVMPANVFGTLLYSASRTYMNVLRSIEPLVLAAIFAGWLRYGAPFAGVLALMLVTQANLGKLFSEAMEEIDPGPLDAIWVTGANRLQVIVYGLLPQIVPPFLSFGMYQWDINVRISTVIGIVSGVGIGAVLYEWRNLTKWTWVSVAVIGIVVVVSAMDYVSSRARDRLV